MSTKKELRVELAQAYRALGLAQNERDGWRNDCHTTQLQLVDREHEVVNLKAALDNQRGVVHNLRADRDLAEYEALSLTAEIESLRHDLEALQTLPPVQTSNPLDDFLERLADLPDYLVAWVEAE